MRILVGQPWRKPSDMASGASAVVAAPLKPWEVSLQPRPDAAGLQGTFLTSPAPPLPPPLTDGFTAASHGYAYSAAGGGTESFWKSPYGGGYYSGASRFGHPYSSPYYGGGGAYGGPPAPGGFLTSSLESTTRPLFDSLNSILQAVNNAAWFVDSTVFAVWSSMTAIGSFLTAARSIKAVCMRRWRDAVRDYSLKMRRLLASSRGRMRLAVALSVMASVPFIIRALMTIIKLGPETLLDETDATANVPTLPIHTDAASEDGDTKAVFVRAIYAHEPTDRNVYLPLRAGDVILISNHDVDKLAQADPCWIVGKLKDGSSGYFPSNHVKMVQ